MAPSEPADDPPSSPLLPVAAAFTPRTSIEDAGSAPKPETEGTASSPESTTANPKAGTDDAAAAPDLTEKAADTSNGEAVDLSRYLVETERLGTFSEWPHERPSAELVAAAGFFFADGGVDAVCCPSCHEVHEGFDGPTAAAADDVWARLTHRRDCPLRPKIGETKNRSCAECHALFATIGSKLNHCKRAHPRPEEERRRRAQERQQRRVAAGLPGDGRRGRKSTKSAAATTAAAAATAATAAASAGSISRRRDKAATAKAKARLQELVRDAAARRRREELAREVGTAAGGREVDAGFDSETDGADAADEGRAAGAGPEVDMQPTHNGLTFSRAVTSVDCEPSTRAGEIVMSRVEYREFRQHFRAMTDIFRDVDPKKRALVGRF